MKSKIEAFKKLKELGIIYNSGYRNFDGRSVEEKRLNEVGFEIMWKGGEVEERKTYIGEILMGFDTDCIGSTACTKSARPEKYTIIYNGQLIEWTSEELEEIKKSEAYKAETARLGRERNTATPVFIF